MTHEWRIGDRMSRLLDIGQQWFIAVDANCVNLDDLIYCMEGEGPGWVVRCAGPPADAIRIFHADSPELGCIAGWISDEDEEEEKEAA